MGAAVALGSAVLSVEGARGTELGGTASSLCSDMKVRLGEETSEPRTRCRGNRSCALRRRESYSLSETSFGFSFIYS